MIRITILPAILATLGLVLGGCGVVAKVDARNQMQASLRDLKQCLRENQANPSPCRTLKIIYDADMSAYRATSAGILPGYNVNVNSYGD